MNAKTTQKLKKSAVASVLLTSTVAVGLPTYANTTDSLTFSDIDTKAYYYEPLKELVANKVINGYPDGTFKPEKNITRAEAAKIIAVSMNLDIDHATTNKFTDVSPDNFFYKYIAALANEGVINGFPDHTFRPEETVTREAMAKMIALGYKFQLAQQTYHTFKDIDHQNFFRYYIQTLVDLEITTGTAFDQYSPTTPVTRAQLVTFISRANKASAGQPAHKIDNVIGNKVYINSVGYEIGPAISSFIKESNKAALIGAEIEGNLNSKMLTSVTKLTLNAVGSEHNIYTFDGGYSSFNGDVVIKGSYLRFVNWSLNGTTTIAEAPRKSLQAYVTNMPVAYNSSGYIDFTTPNNPDDGNLGSDNGLNPNNPPKAYYDEKLKDIKAYVDFTTVFVKQLIVEKDGAVVYSERELPKVVIRRDVEFVELNFDMVELYLEQDQSLTIYGTHNIETVYKNSFFSVYFNNDSHIGTLVVNNVSGWIDLGTFVTIDKVILPAGTTPNDIFDDFKNDNDKIGEIIDDNGDDVDREPIDDGIIPDVTKPIVKSISITPDSNTATVTVTVNETGKYHYVVLPEGEAPPTVREIVSMQNGLTGSGPITDAHYVDEGEYTTSFLITGLDSVTKYKLYFVHVDDAGNFSGRQENAFETRDGTPPYFLSSSATSLAGGRRIQLDFKPSELGTYYYMVREQQNIDTTITVDDIINGANATGVITPNDITNGYSKIIRDINGLPIKPSTNYVVYVALVDTSGNKILQQNIARLRTVTPMLDADAPFVTGPSEAQYQQLIPASDTSLNQFYMYFNERLDKTTAENPNNYQLTGTGIVNVPGQKPIIPTKVEYSNYGTNSSRVLITIPSLTGFVHGDTLRVTVLPGVKDLAENDFENVTNLPPNIISARNYAEYRHEDPLEPLIAIRTITRNDTNTTAVVDYRTNKAGTLYYMILPNSFDFEGSGITNEDFVKEFDGRATTKFNRPSGGKYYLEGSIDNLKEPITATLGDSSFVYKYDTLNPQAFESYSVYMVLKDRSGRLSPVERQTLIADEVAPQISAFDVRMNDGSERDGKLTLSSNEKGLAHFAYVEKYVFDTTTRKYILNPAIFDGMRYKEIGNSSSSDSINKQSFISTFKSIGATVIENKVLTAGSANNQYDISFLKPNTEYVVFTAVEDEFQNFTVKDNASHLMAREIYTDGIKPSVVSNVIYRNLEMPNDPDTSFTLTFTETLGRVYADQNVMKDSLAETTQITANTPLEDVLTLTDLNGQDITNEFAIVSYTVGSPANPQSKLVIKPKTQASANQTFAAEVKSLDQYIGNYGNSVPVSLIDYVYPGVNLLNQFEYARLVSTNSSAEESVTVRLSLDLGVQSSLDQSFYYAVFNSTFTQAIPSKSLIQTIINYSNTGNNAYIDGQSIISYGKERIEGVSSTSFIKDLQAIQYSTSTTNVFKKGHKVFLFTVDRYGNVVWAVDKQNPSEKYITIIGPTPVTP